MSTAILAYGYVWLHRANMEREESLRHQIADYCKREGLTLGVILTDTAVSRIDQRSGWISLLGRLNSAVIEAVAVLFTLDHLSRDPVQQVAMHADIYAAGGRVRLVAP